MASYIEESLSDGEEIKDRYGMHWINWALVWFLVIISPLTLGIALIYAIYLALLRKINI